MELVSKNTSLFVQQCCGKKCFKLWCVLSAVKRILMIVVCYGCMDLSLLVLAIRYSMFFLAFFLGLLYVLV